MFSAQNRLGSFLQNLSLVRYRQVVFPEVCVSLHQARYWVVSIGVPLSCGKVQISQAGRYVNDRMRKHVNFLVVPSLAI